MMVLSYFCFQLNNVVSKLIIFPINVSKLIDTSIIAHFSEDFLKIKYFKPQKCKSFVQQVAQIIAESEKFLRLKVLPDESSSEEETDEDEELDEEGKPKLKQPKAKKDSWWATEK